MYPIPILDTLACGLTGLDHIGVVALQVGKRDSKQSVTSALFLQGGQVLASAGSHA